jgi:hypothetical protein
MNARRLAAVILSASAVAGCGGKSTLLRSSSTAGSSATASHSTSAPAASAPAGTAPAGTVKSADGRFATVIPGGFVDATKSVRGSAINIQYLAVGPRRQGFATNINVVREQSPGQTDIDKIAGLEIAGIKRLEPGAHNFSQVQSLTVGGQPARSVDYISRPGKRPLHQFQVFVAQGGWIYTITYSALPGDYSASLASVKQITDGWHWVA